MESSATILRALSVMGLVAGAVPAVAGGPLAITNQLLVEQRVAARDGTTRIKLVEARRAVPGDRLQVVLSYRNAGGRPIADLVLANPVPAHLAYRGPAEGSPAPDVSVDGRQFAPLTALRVSMPAGGQRAAGVDDVVAVRWRLASSVPAAASGTLAFRAVLR